MTFRKNEIIDQFHTGDALLPVVSSCCDFDVIISSNLSPSTHISDIVLRPIKEPS